MDILKRAKELTPDIVAYRRRFHEYPELGGKEKLTTEFIAAELKKYGIEAKTDYSQLAVSGMIYGANPNGKTIMLRADIDALPIIEEADVPFKSKHEGVMHACGHDMHGASLLGAARILQEMRGELGGNVKLCFQPSEEVKGLGANIFVADGILENPHVDFVMGTHVDPALPVGMASLIPGPVTAYPDGFEVKFTSGGGHGSAPATSKDPIMAAVLLHSLITAMNKQINPLEPHVAQVCMISAGSASNIIPAEATIAGTVRTLHKHNQQYIKARIEELAKHVSEIYGLGYEYSHSGTTPGVYNTPEYVEPIKQTCLPFLPHGFDPNAVPGLGGEDFSQYIQDRPGVFMNVGCNDGTERTAVKVHKPLFCPDEGELTVAAACYAAVATDYLAGKYDVK